jgi:hypothetical protein
MRVWLFVLPMFALVACEPKPSPEVLAEQEQAAEAARATPKTTPKPKQGDWMLKDYKNPLDGSKKPGQR